MYFPKIVAYVLIAGLLICSCSYAERIPIVGTALPEELPVNRDRLSGLSGGEQNIDPFTVNPINRWDSSVSGPLTTGIKNGELSLETYLNDSSSSYYFRESSTADDTISVRWRLNQIADMVDNETDFYLVSRLYGPDGMSWQENVDEACNWGGLDNEIVSGGIYEARCAAGASAVLAPDGGTLEYIDTSIFEIFNFYLKTNDSELNFVIWGKDGAGVLRYLSTLQSIPDTDWNLYSVNLSLSASWTGLFRYIFITFDEDDDTLDGDEGIWIDYIKITGDSEYQGDFSIPLCGLNATTSEGTGNTSLTAYQHNGTHYNIRPSFTTEDGTNSRSWNLDSDYQGYAQMDGTWGSDGWDFVEGGLDGWWVKPGAGTAPTPTEYGYISWAFVNNSWSVPQHKSLSVTTSHYDYLSLKFRTNVTLYYLRFFGTDVGDGLITDSQDTWVRGLDPNVWYTRTLELNSNWDKLTTQTSIEFHFLSKSGAVKLDLDYFMLLTDNDSSDLTYFEFNEYYRSELDYDLRSSELEFELQDDLGDDVSKEEIGAFTIADYFDAGDLIPDMFQAEVGLIDYLFGVRSAGSNGTCWWDFYQAEFVEFYFELISFTEGDDSLDSYSAYSVYNEFENSPDDTHVVVYSLTVPEFDSCSGRLVINELADIDDQWERIRFMIYSVTTTTGALVEEGQIDLVSQHISNNASKPFYLGLETDNVYPGVWSNGLEGLNIPEDKSTGEASFCIYFDKVSRKLSFQLSANENHTAGIREIRLVGTADVAASQSNEFVVQIQYHVHTDSGGYGTVHMSLEDWSLTFRDIFSGLIPDIPSIDDVLGGLAGFLGNILRALFAPIALALDELAKLLSPLGGILSKLDVLDLIESAIDGIGSAITGAITSLETALDAMVDGFGDVVDAAMEIISDAIDDFTSAIGLLAAQIWTAVTDGLSVLLTAVEAILGDITDAGVNFIRGIGAGGTTIGDVLDLVGSMLDLFVLTIADTLEWSVMMITIWTAMVIVLIFVLILFCAIASSDQPGQVFGKIFTAFSVNIMPISIWGFRIHIPLAVLIIPFIFIVILGIV